MGSDSRTGKSITNAKTSLFFIIATFLLNFFSRKFFLEGPGAEVMGMRDTLTSVLSMLSITELGIGSAVGVALFKPLTDKNYKELSEIVSLQGWLYNRVFAVITIGVVAVMFYLPHLLGDMQAPMYYAYITVLVFYIGVMLSYTVNYKSIVLMVDQRNYTLTRINSSLNLIKGVVQLLALWLLEKPYLYWLAADLIAVLITVYLTERAVKQRYPWLQIDKSRGREYFRKYPGVIRNTWQIASNSITFFIVTQSTPWFVSQYVGLVMVAFYGNYKNLIANMRALIYAVFGNLGAGVGSLISEGNKEKTYGFFWESLSIMYFVGGIAGFILFAFSNPFISLWLGGEYLLGLLSVILLTLTAYLDYTKGTLDAYVGGHKLFGDVWVAPTQGLLTIITVVFLGRHMGLDGILLGMYVWMALAAKVWKPYYLFKHAFGRSGWEYWRSNAKFPLFTFLLAALWYGIIQWLELDLNSSYLQLIKHAVWITACYALMLFGLFYSTSEGFRKVSYRIYLLVEPWILPLIRRCRR